MAELGKGAAHLFRQLRALTGGPYLHQRVIGLDTVADAGLGLLHQIVDARNLRVERAGADEAHHPRDLNREMRFACFLIGKTDGREGGRCRLGFPHGLDGGELHLLVFGGEIAAFITQHDDRQRGRQTEGGGDRHRALGEIDMTAFQHIPGRNAEHEDGGRHVTRRHRVDELRLRHRVEQDLEEVSHFHAHGLGIESGARGVLHPAIGDQYP